LTKLRIKTFVVSVKKPQISQYIKQETACRFPKTKRIKVPRAGFEPATTKQASFGNWDEYQQDLEDFKLFLKSKMNFTQSTAYHYTSKLRTFLRDRKSVTDKDIQFQSF
jgi:hypothetical protein